MKRSSVAAAFLAVVPMLLPLTSRATDYSEAVNGNLSSNHLAPTVVTVTPGMNSISGGLNTSYDYATFTVPKGYAMTSLTLGSFTTGGSGAASFFAIAPGTSSPIVPFGNTAVGLLGWLMFNSQSIGPNLLPYIGQSGSGATDFTGPLPAGAYTFWIQDFSDTITYKFSFYLEPAAPPIIKINKDQKLNNRKVTLTGTASGTGAKVTYRVGTKGAFKQAKGAGLSPWTINASGLKLGKNIITIHATSQFGTSSTRVAVTVKK
ncbi:MAG: hypothetical protein ACREKL_14410 [Chthoniobacterales bacterium]